MSIQLGQAAPDFEQDATVGRIASHQWLGDSWGVLFSRPKDFTPVCTAGLGEAARMRPEFDKRRVRVIGLSVDSPGGRAIIVPGVSDDDARKQFPQGWEAKKPRLRFAGAGGAGK